MSELSQWKALEKVEHIHELSNEIKNSGKYLVVIQTNFNEQAVKRIIIN